MVCPAAKRAQAALKWTKIDFATGSSPAKPFEFSALARQGSKVMLARLLRRLTGMLRHIHLS
jgi:hypothetical protein